MNYEVTVYFCNPNIFPESEYTKRLEAQKILCNKLDCKLIIEDYKPKDFYSIAIGLENEPEKGKRCAKCFELRLEKTAQKSKELGIPNFTTSIPISPHKDFELLSQIGKTISQKYDISYIKIDFKKNNGFLNSNNLAKSFELYRQNYCGCEYSIRVNGEQ